MYTDVNRICCTDKFTFSNWHASLKMSIKIESFNFM